MRSGSLQSASTAETIRELHGGGTRRIAETTDLVLERGSGSFVFASDGSRYLDAISGFGVASIGHCHPHWVGAVQAQAERLAVTPLYTPELGRLLEALAEVLPAPVNRTALFSGGAEAVEVAVRLAQTASGRSGVLSFERSFHGKTSAVRYSSDPSSPEARLLGPSWLRAFPFPACIGHDAVDYESCGESAAGLVEAIGGREDLREEVGAVVVEPVLGTAGNIPPARRFLSELRALCDQRGWLLVFDESITGFGRTGDLFAFEHFGVAPDVLVLGKGMGGGLPLSAVCASAELWRSSVLGVPSATSSSFGGNPLACAAGLATLEVIGGDGFLDNVRSVGRRLAQGLRDLAAASPRVARPRGVGLMLGFDLVDPDSGQLADTASCSAVCLACRDRGVLVVADVPRVRLSPPLTLSPGEADELLDVLFEVLA